jgi:hypothetical protein
MKAKYIFILSAIVLALLLTLATYMAVVSNQDKQQTDKTWNARCKRSDGCWQWFKLCCAHRTTWDCTAAGKELFP